MTPHVLVAVDAFAEPHLREIADAIMGWAAWKRVAEDALEPVYREALSHAEVVVGWPRAEWLLPSPTRFLQLGSAGYDAYLMHGLGRKTGFTLCTARGTMSVPVAEHCIALMLALGRRLPQHARDMAVARWQRQPTYNEVTGATVCVVGLGDIGTEVGRRCAGLGMRVVGVRRDANRPDDVAERVYPASALREAVATAEHVVLTLPGGPETAGLIDAGVLNAMKPGAYLYNVSRGSVVDEAALIALLRSGHLAGAGLDVFAEEPLPADNPLWGMDNVLITPHAGGQSVRFADRLCQRFVANLALYRAGEPLVNAVPLD